MFHLQRFRQFRLLKILLLPIPLCFFRSLKVLKRLLRRSSQKLRPIFSEPKPMRSVQVCHLIVYPVVLLIRSKKPVIKLYNLLLMDLFAKSFGFLKLLYGLPVVLRGAQPLLLILLELLRMLIKSIRGSITKLSSSPNIHPSVTIVPNGTLLLTLTRVIKEVL